MSSRYTAGGRRRSSMTHATRGHQCDLCPKIAFGNGGQVAHGRGHVRRGEAVELLMERWMSDGRPMHTRLFLAPDDERVPEFLDKGFVRVEQ